MNARFFSLLAVLFLSISPAIGQDIIRDIARLKPLLPSNQHEDSAQVSSPQLDTILAVLAIYGQSDRDDAQVVRVPQDILNVYRTNPFIYPLLTREKIFEPILVRKTSLDTLQKQIPGLRDPTREKLLKQLAANDVYTDNRMLSIPLLQAEYATPPMPKEEILRQQTKALKEQSAKDPTSLATNLLVGLADWISERAQEEFTNTFLSHLQDDLEKKKLQYLFPSTAQYLNQLNIANYRTIIPNAQLAFGQDLRSLSLNVSNYLYKANRLSESDPAAFNFLLLYRLIDLSQQEIPLLDVLAYARGEMNRRRFEAEQSINLQLGKNNNQDAYTDLQAKYAAAVTQLTNVYDLEKKEADRLIFKYTSIPRADRMAFPDYDARIKRLIQAVDEVQFTQLFQQNKYYLSEAIQLLKGSLDYDQLNVNPSIKVFEQKFLGQEPPQDSTLRAIGLSMTRHLLRTKADTVEVLRHIYSFYRNLRELKSEIEQLEDNIAATHNTARSARQSLLNQVNLLETGLKNEEVYWAARANVKIHDQKSITYLYNLLSKIKAKPDTLNLNELTNFIKQIEELSAQQVQYLNAKYPSLTPSPLAPREIPIKVDPLQNAIDATEMDFLALKQSLNTAEATLVMKPLRSSYTNAANFETILEVLSQMLYCLYLPADDSYLSPMRLNSLLNNADTRQLFLGLVYQRIAQLPNLGPIAPSGIASISSSLVQSMADYGNAPDSTSTLRIVNKIQFASNALNTLMETPLLLTGASFQAQSLHQAVPAFGKVPSINRELTQLFVLSAKGEYRNAIGHVLNLVDLFNAYPNAQKRLQVKRERLGIAVQELDAFSTRATGSPLSLDQLADSIKISKRIDQLKANIVRLDTNSNDRFRNSLFLYTHFFADVASANSHDQIKSAIQSVALPQGSSQNKRQQWTSVELNAYFGGGVAYERLLSDEVSNRPRLNNYSLFVPVGLSISRRLSQKSEFSMSIFLPIIDLGTLTAYRTDPKHQGERLPDITFGNVLSPGAHLFLNFGKSPFFIGGGLQYGPNTRNIEINQQATKVEAMRYMLTFGIDVPILSFSRRL